MEPSRTAAGHGRPSRHFRIDQPPAEPPGAHARAVLRGLRSAVVLVLTGVWELVCAVLHLPPVRAYAHRAAAEIREAYSDGVNDIHEAVVVDGFDDIGDER